MPALTLSVDEIRMLVEVHIPPNTPAGESLDPLTIEFIEYAVRSSVTTLDPHDAQLHAQRALSLGASTAQLHEILVLVSALGVHSLMIGSARLAQPSELPGVHVHVGNALSLGGGRKPLLEVLEIAARAPLHSGVR